MVEGEFEVMSVLYKVAPGMVRQPRAWGKTQDGSDDYFYLCNFLDLDDRLLDPLEFGSRLAGIHRLSESPKGMFGFHVATCHGRIPQPVDWNPSWQTFFTKLLRHWFKADQDLNGSWPQFEELQSQLILKVIPVLLGPLQSENRTIKPVLIHGDLWRGNISHTNGEICVLDAEGYYAHHEMELAIWRWPESKLGTEEYLKAYLDHFPPSDPPDRFDDRNRLYCIKLYMSYSAHFRNSSYRKRRGMFDF